MMIARASWILILLCLASWVPAHAQVLYVNPVIGLDTQAGTEAQPLATVQRAINLATPGTVIHLQPDNAIYRQSFELKEKHDLTIEGHGVTLTGADPLPPDGWESMGDGLFRRQVRRLFQDRAMLIVNGRMERMGRRQGSKVEVFPAPQDIKEGQFSYVPIDTDHAWLYVRGSTEKLEWSVRMTGMETWGVNRNITVRNLHARHALNDGFNIHGDCRGLRCFNISGYDNFDEGFSAHDTSETYVETGLFHGNENAVADVNGSDSVYVDCEFRQSMSAEVLFYGGAHRLIRCRIIASAPVVIGIAPDSRKVDGQRVPAPVSLVMEDCQVQSVDAVVRPLEFNAAQSVTLTNTSLRGVVIQAKDSPITAQGVTLDGQPWSP